MLNNGQGAVDWAGLPVVVALLGITDVEAFVHRLMTIRAHRPDDDGDNSAPAAADPPQDTTL